MVVNRNKNAKNLFLNIMLLTATVVFLFGCGEILFRAFFPEYKNHIFSPTVSLGKKMFSASVAGLDLRSPTGKFHLTFDSGDRVVLVFGDSISRGYGLAYEDVFWNYWQRMVNLQGRAIKILAFTAPANNFMNCFDAIHCSISFFREKGVTIAGIVYQFNFNDIHPYTRQDIKALNHIKSKSGLISKTIIFTNSLRLRFLYRSVMLRVLCNKTTKIFFNNTNTSCSELGLDGLGSYTYTFGARNSETISKKIWRDFESELAKIKAELGQIPLVVLISPIAEFIEPDMKLHSLSRPKRFDCATIDPKQRLVNICDKLDINLVNPTGYMKTHFENYIREGNPVLFYHLNDDNHFNEIGSKYFAEYSYSKIFNHGIIR